MTFLWNDIIMEYVWCPDEVSKKESFDIFIFLYELV